MLKIRKICEYGIHNYKLSIIIILKLGTWAWSRSPELYTKIQNNGSPININLATSRLPPISRKGRRLRSNRETCLGNIMLKQISQPENTLRRVGGGWWGADGGGVKVKFEILGYVLPF